MKKWSWLSFIIGCIVGAILMFFIGTFASFMISTHKTADDIKKEITMLQAGEIGAEIKTENIKVKRVLAPNIAVAATADKKLSSGDYLYGNTEVVYLAPENEKLFVDQSVDIPQDKKLIQVGTYEMGHGYVLAVVEIK